MNPEQMEPDPSLTGWLHNYARRHLWRVPSYVRLDDLIQDGMAYFYTVRERYGPDIKNKSHLMSLFKRCFANHITRLGEKRSRLPEVHVSDIRATEDEETSEQSSWEELLGSEDDQAYFAVLVAEAPPEIQAVLALLTSDKGIRQLESPHREFLDHRETTNEKLCRLTGYDPSKINLAAKVRNYFRSR